MEHPGTQFLPDEVPKRLSGILTTFLILLLLPATALAQELNHSAPDEAVVEGVLHIKVAETAAPSVQLGVQDGVAQLGIASLDQLGAEFQATRIEQMFRTDPRYAERHAEWGLDRWYRVYFDQDEVALTRDAVLAFHADANTELAEHVLDKEHTMSFMNEGTASFVEDVEAQLNDFPDGDPNDPQFDDQWHYLNTGQTGGTVGADISLTPAWQIETGSPDVVVQVVDAGMQIDHPDLEQNLWINPCEEDDGMDTCDNGYVDDIYGYNFANDNADVSPNNSFNEGDSHGIHVSGTVAAVTNNDEGVSGVAGGDGSPDSGVRIMTAQTFSNFNAGFAEALIYGADNGAVISNNSWGYTSPGFFEQAVLDAIDYFNDEAGGPDAPMNGGLVVFSAGNSNSDGEQYPGFYETAMAVGATDHDDGRASYSTFGDWVEIAAPGGEAFIHPVISTLHEDVGAYGGDIWSGTSMAAPHVAGTAALLASNDPGLSNDLVRSTLIETADPIDTDQPIGPRVNAQQTLEGVPEDDGEPPVAIDDLEVTNVMATSVDLAWTSPEGTASSYDVRFSTDPIEDADDFANATPIDDPPSALPPGFEQEATVSGLAPLTEYFFAITSDDDFGNTSDISNVVSATTEDAPVLAVDPEAVEQSATVGGSAQDLLTVSNEGGADVTYEVSIGFSGSEISDPIAPPPTPATASYDATPEDELSTGAAPDDLVPAEDYYQRTLTRPDIEETNYWGVLSTGVGVNDFGFFSGDAPDDFNVVGDYPGTGFSNAGDFPVGDDSFVYELDNEGNLRAITLSDGSVEELGTVGSDWTGWATDPTDGTYYINTGDDLFTLDVDNLETEQVGSFGVPLMIGIAIDGDGQMYGYSVQTNQFYAIDKETGDAEEIGDIGFDANFGQGLSWDSQNDEIVMAAFNNTSLQAEFRIVDRETGNSELIGPLEDQMGWLATPVDGAGQWLTVDPLEGELSPGESDDLDLFFETTFVEEDDLIGGLNYLAEVTVASPNPEVPAQEVPVTFTVEGDAELVLSDETLDFGSAFAGTTVTETLTISNEGNAILQIGDLFVDGDAFSVNSGAFDLNPGDAMDVPVAFAPDASESFEGVLTIASSEGNIEVALQGEGAPFVALDPDELTQTIDLTTGDSTATQEFSITNEFDEPLPVSLFIEQLEGQTINFFPQLADEELMRYRQLAQVKPVSDPDLEPSMETAPNSSERNMQGDVRQFADLMDAVDVIGYANEVLEEEIVAFDLGVPEELTVVDGGVDSFAGNFVFGNNEEIYWIDNADNVLKTYALDDGSVEEIGELVPESATEGWTDMETDYTDGTTYVTTYDDASGESRLYELDPDNAEVTFLGDFYDGLNIAFAIDDEGQAFGHGITDDVILSVDLETVTSEVIGSTGIEANFAQSMTFDSETGQLLMAALHNCTFLGCTDGDLRVVDRETGGTSLVGPFGDDGTLREMGWFATEGQGITWLSTNLTQVTIQPGKSVHVKADFDASELIEGEYEAQISIVGDDLPGQPAEALPVFLTVIGEADLFLSQEALAFGEVFVNDTAAPQMVTIRNDGTADLNITDVSTDLEYFQFDGPESFTLEPGDAEVFDVTFAPGSVGEFEATLTFDGEEASGEVTLTGDGIPAPELAVDPASFDQQILIGQVEEYDLEVTNVGADTLEYNAAIGSEPEGLAIDGPVEVLLEENFDMPAGDFPPEDWFRAGANDGENWITTDGCFPNDLEVGACFYWSPSTDGTQRLVSPQLDTGAYSEIIAQFTHEIDDFSGGYDVRLETTGDGGETWTTVAEFPDDNVTLTDEMISIDNDDVGSDEFHLAWTFEGDSFAINHWGFTDLSVFGALNWLTIDPEEGALEADESLVHTLTVDATELEPGVQELGVIVNTNDPLAPTAFVPFTLNVVENITVSTPEAELNPNQVATVPVTVESLDDLGVISYQFTLEYDPELLSAIGVNTEGTLSEGADIAVNNEEDGVVSIAAFDVGTDGTDTDGGAELFQIEGEGTLIELEIQAQEALGETTPVATEFLFNEGLDSQTGPGANAELGTVSVVPLFGDIALNLDVTSFDAALALQSAVGLVDLNEAQATSGDVSDSGSVTAFDGGLIQQFVVGLIDSFPVQGDDDALMAAATAEEADASFAWSDATSEGTQTQLPLTVEDADGPITSVALTAPIDANLMTVDDVMSQLPEDWMIAHNVEDDVLHIAMAGATPLESGQVATVAISWLDDDAQMTFDSEVTVNQNAPQSLSAEIGTTPDEFVLHENYPNPFRGDTTIEYELPETAHVRIVVFNVLGQEVAVLVDEEQAAGRYDVRWDGEGQTGAPVASGVYIYRIEAGDFSDTQRATRVR